MRCSLLTLAGAGAMLVNAQGAAPAIQTIEQFRVALESCLGQCNAGEQDCQQQCIDSIHNPSGDNILAIQYCQYGCVQGDGSYEQNNLFNACLSACSSSNGAHRDPSMGDVVVSSSSANLSTTGTAATTTLVAASNTAIGTSTGSSKTSSSVSATASSTATGGLTSDAGDAVRIGMGGLGLFGLVAAFFM